MPQHQIRPEPSPKPRHEPRPAARRDGGRRLTADDWAQAALAAIGEQGLAAVAVEPLAVRLNTTKGSFYWHFRNREALIEAALARWEQAHTEAIIEALSGETDPGRRLRALFTSVGLGGSPRPGGVGAIEVNLLSAADHPAVAAVLRRVVERRLGYLRQIFVDLGLDHTQAQERALLAYTGYVGTAQLAQRAPHALPSGAAAWSSYMDSVVRLLLSE